VKQGERALFFTLWGLILVCVGLWKFWPDSASLPPAPFPSITLREDLHQLMTSALITEAAPGHFTVTLNVSDPYRARLQGKDRQIQVGYQYLRERTLLSDGAVAVRLDPGESRMTITLPNPERVSPQTIHLYLAQ
jgi:hypothetical protein